MYSLKLTITLIKIASGFALQSYDSISNL